MKVSVAMIVKNEETCIKQCLMSLQGFDEIVIVDTGSLDDTEEAVLSLNMPQVKYLPNEFLWNDDFSAARNFSIDACSGDWVLIMDADNCLEKGGEEKIRRAVENTRENVLNCCIYNKEFFSSYVHLRLLRKTSGVRYVGAVHECLSQTSKSPAVATIFDWQSPSHEADPERNFRILKKTYGRNPRDSRTLYYFAREFWYRKDYAAAIELFNSYLKVAKYLPEIADAYLYLARMFWKLNRGDEARDACMKAITINANFKEALCFMAELSFEHNAVRWREFAKLANNEKVLFVRPCCVK